LPDFPWVSIPTLGKYAKIPQKTLNDHKIYRMTTQNLPNGHKIYKKIYHWGFLVSKYIYHLATLVAMIYKELERGN
jgi:hypothetical protein